MVGNVLRGSLSSRCAAPPFRSGPSGDRLPRRTLTTLRQRRPRPVQWPRTPPGGTQHRRPHYRLNRPLAHIDTTAAHKNMRRCEPRDWQRTDIVVSEGCLTPSCDTPPRHKRSDSVHLVDGNQYFNRPGPRLVESAEVLAEILHPQEFIFGRQGIGWKRFPS